MVKTVCQSDFCGVLLNFKADFRIMISNIFKIVQDKIKGVTPPCTPIGRKLYLGRYWDLRG